MSGIPRRKEENFLPIRLKQKEKEEDRPDYWTCPKCGVIYLNSWFYCPRCDGEK